MISTVASHQEGSWFKPPLWLGPFCVEHFLPFVAGWVFSDDSKLDVRACDYPSLYALLLHCNGTGNSM